MGAFQAGALVALLDAGVVPDALYGSSAGALNGAFLASRPDLSRA
jgi:NTE family protein